MDDLKANVKATIGAASDGFGDAVDAGTRGGSDLLSRTRENVGAAAAGVKAGVTDRLANAGERITSGDLPGSARRAAGIAAENPLGLMLGALAVGFVAGSMLPISEAERKRLQPIGDRIAGQAQAATSDLIAAGKAVAVETAHTAVATALSSAKTHGQEVVDAAKARA